MVLVCLQKRSKQTSGLQEKAVRIMIWLKLLALLVLLESVHLPILVYVLICHFLLRKYTQILDACVMLIEKTWTI